MLESTGEVPAAVQPIGTVYYGYQDIFVTDRLLVCAGRKVCLSQLSNVHTRRAALSAVTVNATIAVGAAGVVLIIAGSLLDGAAWLATVLVLAVPVALVLAGLARRRPYELWADCASQRSDGAVARILLLRVSDPERYRQICRAIVRAQERGRS